MIEKELAKELQNWFNNTNEKSDKNFWTRNPVGTALKINLKNWKHWKNKPRPRHNW